MGKEAGINAERMPPSYLLPQVWKGRTLVRFGKGKIYVPFMFARSVLILSRSILIALTVQANKLFTPILQQWRYKLHQHIFRFYKTSCTCSHKPTVQAHLFSANKHATKAQKTNMSLNHAKAWCYTCTIGFLYTSDLVVPSTYSAPGSLTTGFCLYPCVRQYNQRQTATAISTKAEHINAAAISSKAIELNKTAIAATPKESSRDQLTMVYTLKRR